MPKGKKTKASDWLVFIEEWKQSDLNKKNFCLSRNIPYKNFTKWYSRLVQPRKAKQAFMNSMASSNIDMPLFIPVKIKSNEKQIISSCEKPIVLMLNESLQLQIPAENINETFLTMLFKSLKVLA